MGWVGGVVAVVVVVVVVVVAGAGVVVVEAVTLRTSCPAESSVGCFAGVVEREYVVSAPQAASTTPIVTRNFIFFKVSPNRARGYNAGLRLQLGLSVEE